MDNNVFQSSTNANPPKDNWAKIIVGGMAIFLCVCMIAGAALLFYYARPYLDTKTIILEPDHSQVSEVNRTTLEETAHILTERCDFMGCNTVTFTLSDNQIVGKIPVYMDLDIAAIVSDITTIGLLEFTDFGNSPIPVGTAITTDFKHPFLLQVDQKAWHTIMTNAEIETAVVSRDQFGKYLVDFTLTEVGSKIFTNYTSENVGSYLGIILDKVVLSMPQVNGPITGGQGQIAGNFDAESASNLAAYLNISPLPIPLVLVDVGE